jgi:hypothetical protein
MVKGLLCRKCGDLVIMTDDIRACKCKKVRGHYGVDGSSIFIDGDEIRHASIVGIDNRFLLTGQVPDYKNSSEPDSLFKQRGSAIIMVPPFTTNDVFSLFQEKDFIKCITCGKLYVNFEKNCPRCGADQPSNA